jgi:hypothetical protein
MRGLVLAVALAACAPDAAPAPAGGSGSAITPRERPAQVVQITLKALGIT